MKPIRARIQRAAPLAGAVGIIAALFLGVALAGAAATRIPLRDGMRAPRGITPLDDGSMLVAEVLGGRLLRMQPDGATQVIADDLPATLGGPTSTYPTGISAAVEVDGAYYFIVGEFRGRGYSALYRLDPGGTPEIVAGGIGDDGFPATDIVNPYDLVPAAGGGVFISDGGANAVLHVAPSGTISEYASFPRRENPTPDMRTTIDVVPTGLAYGPDGALYMASLTGIPYPRDAAIVYRLEDLNADGDALDVGEVTEYAHGFSAATDLAFDTKGDLLVTEFSRDMPALVSEYSLDDAAQVPGRLVRWRDGEIEQVAGGLVSPTAVAIVGGRIFVSEEFAGRVTEIRPNSIVQTLWTPLAFEAGVAVLILLTGIAGIWRQSRI